MMVQIPLIYFFVFLFILYKFYFRQYSYWKKRNIPYLKPVPIFGNITSIFLQRCNLGETLAEIYKNSTEPFIGFFMLHKPTLLIRDPDLIRKIFIEKFEYFPNRTVSDGVPASATGALVCKLETWKFVRKAINASFSVIRLKLLWHSFENSIIGMVDYLIEATSKKTDISMRDVSLRTAMDAICSVCFGIDSECFEKENPTLLMLGLSIFNYIHFRRAAQIQMFFISPMIAKFLKLEFFEMSSTEAVLNRFASCIADREKKSESRGDYLDSLKNAIQQYTGNGNLLEGSIEIFVGGFEAVSSIMAFCSYELAKNRRIQEQLREEVINFSTTQKESRFAEIQKLRYLDLVVKEAFRMYPIIPFLDRICEKETYLEEANITIEKGTYVYVSILGIHYDPRYYPEPYAFNPERFKKTDWSVYFPFGKGPRTCLAKKYCELLLKCWLVNMLSNFELRLSPKSPKKITFNPRGFSLEAVGDMFLEVHRI